MSTKKLITKKFFDSIVKLDAKSDDELRTAIANTYGKYIDDRLQHDLPDEEKVHLHAVEHGYWKKLAVHPQRDWSKEIASQAEDWQLEKENQIIDFYAKLKAALEKNSDNPDNKQSAAEIPARQAKDIKILEKHVLAWHQEGNTLGKKASEAFKRLHAGKMEQITKQAHDVCIDHEETAVKLHDEYAKKRNETLKPWVEEIHAYLIDMKKAKAEGNEQAAFEAHTHLMTHLMTEEIKVETVIKPLHAEYNRKSENSYAAGNAVIKQMFGETKGMLTEAVKINRDSKNKGDMMFKHILKPGEERYL